MAKHLDPHLDWRTVLAELEAQRQAEEKEKSRPFF